MSNIKTRTPNFKFLIPEFNTATWHDELEQNFRSIDALFQNLFGINGFSGIWKPDAQYTAGQVLFVGEDNGSIYEGRLLKVIKDTNTGGFTTFSEAIRANPNDYEFYTDASSAQIFAELSKSWAVHTGSTVKTPEGDDTGEYSAKHYQTLAKNNEEQCETYKNLTDTNVQLTQEAANSAETFAQNSETAAQNALVSEQNSKTSENNSKTSEQNAKISEQKAAESLDNLENRIVSLEGCVGDVGIAPLGIDETQNKRRYLNGQVISQTQFKTFTNVIKKRILANPSLATTEENWQSEVSLSINGTCGKFVIDNTAGTIRLPKYPEYCNKEYIKVASRGNGMTLGITNGQTKGGLAQASTNNTNFGEGVYGQNVSTSTSWTGNNIIGWLGVTTDATKSGIITDFTHATSETLPCKWFIQVATGNEQEADITTEIQLNNPFSLLDYKWSEYELTNASWLLSNGAFHSGTVYKSIYDLLLKIYNGIETKEGVSVRLYTETYEDTDFVLNIAENTFRLPIKVKLASGNRVAGNGTTLGLTDGTSNFGSISHVPNSNTLIKGLFFSTANGYGKNVGASDASSTVQSSNILVGITTDPEKSGIETSSQDLYLYFYVGETIQDANVIAASNALTRIANCLDRTAKSDRETITRWGMPSNKADVLTLGSSGTTYTAPANGYFAFFAQYQSGTDAIVAMQNLSSPAAILGMEHFWYSAKGSARLSCEVKKGDIINITYNCTLKNIYLYFIYAEGEK